MLVEIYIKSSSRQLCIKRVRCVHLGLLLALDFAEELRDETTNDAAPALRVHGVEGIYLCVKQARTCLTNLVGDRLLATSIRSGLTTMCVPHVCRILQTCREPAFQKRFGRPGQ